MPQRFRRSSGEPAPLKPGSRALRIGVVTVMDCGLTDVLMQRRFMRDVAPGIPHVLVHADHDAEAVAASMDPELDREVMLLPMQAGTGLAMARNLGARAMADAGVDLLAFLGADCIPMPGLLEAYRTAFSWAGPFGSYIFNGPITYLGPDDELETMSNRRARSLVDPHPRRVFPPVGDVMSNDAHHLFLAENFAVSVPVWRRIGGFRKGLVTTSYLDLDLAMRAAYYGVDMTWVGGAHVLRRNRPERPATGEALASDSALFTQEWGDDTRWSEGLPVAPLENVHADRRRAAVRIR